MVFLPTYTIIYHGKSTMKNVCKSTRFAESHGFLVGTYHQMHQKKNLTTQGVHPKKNHGTSAAVYKKSVKQTCLGITIQEISNRTHGPRTHPKPENLIALATCLGVRWEGPIQCLMETTTFWWLDVLRYAQLGGQMWYPRWVLSNSMSFFLARKNLKKMSNLVIFVSNWVEAETPKGSACNHKKYKELYQCMNYSDVTGVPCWQLSSRSLQKWLFMQLCKYIHPDGREFPRPLTKWLT